MGTELLRPLPKYCSAYYGRPFHGWEFGESQEGSARVTRIALLAVVIVRNRSYQGNPTDSNQAHQWQVLGRAWASFELLALV